MVSNIDPRALCLFSLICFGKERDKPFLGLGCRSFEYDQDTISVQCNGFEEMTLSDDLKIHALAIQGAPAEDFNLVLIDLSFSHLIINDWDMSSYYRDVNKNVFSRRYRRRSLVAKAVTDVQAWRWADYGFEHVHIEGSALTTRGSQRIYEMLSRRLFSPQLRSLYIINCNILTIESNAFTHLNSLRALTISHNVMSNLDRGMLPEIMPHLWLFDFSHNFLMSLESTFFRGMPSLKEVNFKSNHLTTLPWDLVKPVWRHLVMINLLENNWNCRNLCWSFERISFPHPALFDHTPCSGQEEKMLIGSSRRQDIGCSINHPPRNCIINNRACICKPNGIIVCF